ncbi:MAG: 3'-5' exonuclease [Muribaculaceae bacterium]
MLKLSINKEQLSELPQVLFPGEITIIDNQNTISAAIAKIKESGIVGIDTETRPAFKKGIIHYVALMQVSTRTECFLFRINKIGLNDEIKNFLEDENIIKIGLSLQDDMRMLHKITEFTPNKFIELQNFVKDYNIADKSLQKIYGIIFKGKISKGQRLSNWEAQSLTIAQMNYAAIDAWACLKIYDELISKRFSPKNSPYILIEE